MSEDQYVAFRAVDRPLTDEQIEFAHTQSSRAEISRWSFSNEYHYGDFRGDVDATWPSVPGTRTFQQLCDSAERLHDKAVAREKKQQAEAAKRAAKKAEQERQARMVKMKFDPRKWLAEASSLADARGIANYQATAEILADMREAIGGAEGEKITRTHAAHLWKKHPTLTHLKSALRKRGLIG
jgi:hypothetical protein